MGKMSRLGGRGWTIWKPRRMASADDIFGKTDGPLTRTAGLMSRAALHRGATKNNLRSTTRPAWRPDREAAAGPAGVIVAHVGNQLKDRGGREKQRRMIGLFEIKRRLDRG